VQGFRVIVTGASGYVGQALCSRLGDPDMWIALGRTDPTRLGLPVAFRRVDLSQKLPADVIPKGTDVLVHLAAHRGGETDALGHFHATTAATMYLCEAARLAGVRRVVLGSTTSVYEPGLPADRPLAEEAPRVRSRPLTYGFAKKWAEDAARLQCLLAEPDMELWTLRMGMVVASRVGPQSFIRATVRRLLGGEPYPLTGETGHLLGLVAMEDVLDTISVAIGGKMPAKWDPPGPVWNLVGETRWERDLVAALGRAVGKEPKFVAPKGRDQSGWTKEPLSITGDGARWRREMGGITPRALGPLLEQAARDAAR
jgi:nucleoside-diphosphate-sugar epimerase